MKEVKPNVDDANLGDFIKRKYVEKLYIKGTWPPPPISSQTPFQTLGGKAPEAQPVEKPKFNLRIQPQHQVQKSMSMPKQQDQDLLNFEDNAFKTSFVIFYFKINKLHNILI